MSEATEQTPALREVLDGLIRQGLLDEDQLPSIESHLAKDQQHSDEPWFVKLLLALGAWIAAICFVACLGIAELVDDVAPALFSWAIVFLAAATTLRRLTRHVFPNQLALAFSAMGHFFALWGAVELDWGVEEAGAIAFVALTLCAALYPFYPDSLHRFLSCLLAAACLTTWIVSERLWPLIHVEMLLKLFLLGLVFIERPDLRILKPLGYAMAISVPATLFLVLLPEDVLAGPWWPANGLLAMALIWLYQRIAGGWQTLKSEPMALAAAATIALATFTTPGVLAAIGLMVLGYARRDQYLTGVGAAFFPIFIVVFYYEWQTSLIVKSWMMAGSGVVLLAARYWLSLRGWAEE